MVKCREWYAMACKRRGFDSRSEPFFFGAVVVVVLSSSSDCTFFFLAFVISPYVQFKKKIPSRTSLKT